MATGDDETPETPAAPAPGSLEADLKTLEDLVEAGRAREEIEEHLEKMGATRVAQMKEEKELSSGLQEMMADINEKAKSGLDTATKKLQALRAEIAGLKELTGGQEANNRTVEASRQMAESALEAQKVAIKLAKQLGAEGHSNEQIENRINKIMGTHNVLGYTTVKNLVAQGAAIDKVKSSQRQVGQQLSQNINLGILSIAPMESLAAAGAEFAGAWAQGNRALYTTMKIGQQIDKLAAKTWASAKQLVFTIDAQTKAFQKQFALTGTAGEEQTALMEEQFKDMMHLGVSMEEAAKAQAVLTQTVTEYTMAGAAQRAELSEAALLAGELGVSMDTYGKAVQATMKIQGQTIPEAIETMGELRATAQALGRDQEQFAAEYAASAGKLAKFGDAAVNSFEELQRTAKITGMEMDKLLNITNKFDTFESAAEMSGKLNAALGGNFVNAMDMMMDTDPVSRFESVRDAILDTGLTFDTMSYYQKQFYTESLGLGDVGDLAMMLSGNMDDLAGSTNQTTAEISAQREQAASLVTFQEKLELIITRNAAEIEFIAEKLINFVSKLGQSEYAIYGLLGAMAAWKIASAGAAGWQTMLQIKVATNTLAYQNEAKAVAGLLAPMEAVSMAGNRNTITQHSNAQAHQLQAGAVAENTAAMGAKNKTIQSQNAQLPVNTAELQTNAGAHNRGAVTTTSHTNALRQHAAAQAQSSGATQVDTVATGSHAAAQTTGAAATQAGTVATGNHTAAQTTDTAATELNTVATHSSLKADVLLLASKIKTNVAISGSILLFRLESMGKIGAAAATGIYTVASGLASAANYVFGTSLVAASGGLLLIVPLVIGLVVGIVAMIKKFGLAKVILVAFGVGLVAATGGLILIIPAIMLAVKGIIWFVKNFSRMPEIIGEFVESILGSFSKIGEGIASGASALWEALISPFVLFGEWITSAWDWMLGKSISPFMASIIEGVKAGGQMLFDFLTWPYRMAWKAIKGIWSFFFGESISEFMGSIITGIKAGAAGILDFITAPFEAAAAIIERVFAAIDLEKALIFGGLLAGIIAAAPFMVAAATGLGAIAVSLGLLSAAIGVFTIAIAALGVASAATTPTVSELGIAAKTTADDLSNLSLNAVETVPSLDMLTESFVKLFTAVPVVDFIIFTSTLAAFGLALGIIGYLAPSAALGMTILSFGMFMFAKSFSKLEPGLAALATFVDGMRFLTESVDELLMVAGAFGKIAQAVEDVPTHKAIALTVLTEALATSAVSLAGAGPGTETMETAAVSLAAAGPAAVADKLEVLYGQGYSPPGHGWNTPEGELMENRKGDRTPAGAPTQTEFHGTLQLDGEATRRFLQGEAETVIGNISTGALRK